jgi:hypothetical protein
MQSVLRSKCMGICARAMLGQAVNIGRLGQDVFVVTSCKSAPAGQALIVFAMLLNSSSSRKFTEQQYA